MKNYLLIVISLILVNPVNAQTSNTRSNAKSNLIKGLYNGCASFGDYDGDGDLDLIVMGLDSANYPKTILYKNIGNTYIKVPDQFQGLSNGTAEWGDFDNDGDLDLLFTGYDLLYESHTVVYENTGNDVFIPYHEFFGNSNGEAKWVDLNNDGYLDVVVTGGYFTDVYENFYGTFYYVGDLDCHVDYSSLDVGDYDHDGDMDIIVTGALGFDWNTTYQPIQPVIKIFRNDGNFIFTEVPNNLTAVSQGSVRFCDYDNDGDLDVLIAGKDDNKIAVTKVYMNNGSTFVNINAGLPGIIGGKAVWGDIDNDGKSDIIITGGTSIDTLGLINGSSAAIFKNNGNNSFSAYSFPMYASSYSNVALGDIDIDHKLDVMILGYDPVTQNVYSDLYGGNTSVANTPPTAPTGLSTTLNGNSVTFKWNKSTDTQTPKPALSYNLRVSTTTGGQNIATANSILSTGYRKVVSMGNTGADTTWTLDYMPGGNVYWSVQAVDNAYEGSPFSTNSTFILPPLPPLLNSPTDSNFYVNAQPNLIWNPSIGAATYQFQFSDTISFSNLIVDQSGLTVTNHQFTSNLIWKKKYYWRVKATNTTGTSNWSQIWVFKPDAGINAGHDTTVCWGKPVPLHAIAKGGTPSYTYKWSPGVTLNDSTIFNPISNTTVTTNYIVKVTDQNGWFNYDTIQVKINPLPVVHAMPDITLWPGESTVLFASASGGIPPYDYLWTPGGNPQITPTVSTTYTVLAKDSLGCISAAADTVIIDVMTITEVPTTITGFLEADLALGDYDNDNHLDLLISGKTSASTYTTKLYRNVNNNYVEVSTPLDSQSFGPTCWADFDNDGDLDIFSNYWDPSPSGGRFNTIFQNNNGTFVNLNLHLTYLIFGDAKPIDVDNDGDLDIIACGRTSNGRDTVIIYINENGTFTEVSQSFVGVSAGKIAVCDFDKDGDMDFAIAGTVVSPNSMYSGIPLLQVYRNDNGAFTEVSFQRTELLNSSLSWGDVNGDGYDDLLVTGYYINGGYNMMTRAYINFINYFQVDNTLMTDVAFGSTSLGDLDNDGDLDCIVAGATQPVYPQGPSDNKPITKLYKSQAGYFMNPNINLMGMKFCYTAFGDYDNDGDLDIFISGTDSLGNAATKLYKIDQVIKNTKPNAPGNLTANVNGSQVILKWNRPTDNETQRNQLKYNVRIGTTSTGSEITSPSSDLATGYIRNPANTNNWQDTTYRIEQLAPGTYYWSVQAVDNGKMGSLFANSTFTITGLNAPDLITPAHYAKNIETISSYTWSSVVGAVKYSVQISEDPDFINILIDTTNITTTSFTNNKKLILSTDYYWRAKAIGTSSSGGWSAIGFFRSKPQFSLVNSGLDNASHNTIRCADFDNDGDIDIAYNGVLSTTTGYETVIYRNVNGVFTKIPTNIMGVGDFYGLDWGDYDNDGNVDLLISGADGNNWPFTAVYKNNGDGTFTDINANLPQTKLGSATWGDFDHDGDLDILLCGTSYTQSSSNSERVNAIYKNTNGTFTKYVTNIPSITSGACRFFDFNNDGLLDIAVIGDYQDSITSNSSRIFKIFKNNNGVYQEINDSNLLGMSYASIDFGDCNNDGLMDIATSGYTTSAGSPGNHIKIYKNNGDETFSLIADNLTGGEKFQVIWGDYNNDGNLDLIASIYRYGVTKLYAYKNTNGTFSLKDVDLGDNKWGTYCWVDLDNDHDLDLITSGITGIANNTATQLFINNNPVANTKPTPPTNLSYSFQANNLILNWTASTDVETPSAGLTYNIVVGPTAGTQSICGPMSFLSNGYRKVVQMGNEESGTTASISGLTPGQYYWGVQAIDNCFEGSVFSIFGAINIPEISKDFGNYSIYPNPSSGIFTINSNQSTDKTRIINVYDITGKRIYSNASKSFKEGLFSLDLSDMRKGFYMLNIIDDDASSSTKIVID